MDQASRITEVIEEAETEVSVSVKEKAVKVWSNAQKADIITMFNEGHSMGRIGDKYGVTRNLIAGIIHRERAKGKAALTPVKERQAKFLPRDAKFTKPKGSPSVQPAPKGLPTGSFLLKPPIKEPRVRLRMIESDNAVTFAQLESHHCKWPLGNPRQSDFRFCGCRRLAGRPYCEEHTVVAGKMYTGPQPKAAPFRLPR